jgi:hypothetical protein
MRSRPVSAKGDEAVRKLNALKPLLSTRPNNTVIGVGEDTGVFRHVCSSCGGSHRDYLYIKHKPGCSFAAHWKAIEALRKMLVPVRSKAKGGKP